MSRSVAMLIMLVMATTIAAAQTHTIDSLLQAVYRAGNDRSKLTAILSLCEEYQSVNRDTLDHYSYKARELAAKTGDKHAMALAEMAVANDYYRWGWLDSAVATIAPVVKAHSPIVPAQRELYFTAARQQALYYGSHSKYHEALALLYRLVREAEQYNDTLVMCSNMNTIGSIAIARQAPGEALQWLRRALQPLGEANRFNAVRASVFTNLAQAWLVSDHLDSAVIYGERGIALMRKGRNLYNLGIALQRQSDIYLKGGNTAKAEAALQEMIAVRAKMGDGVVLSEDNLSLINFYISTRQIDKAISYCKEKLVTGDLHGNGSLPSRTLSNKLSVRIHYYELLARCYKAKDDNKAYAETLEQILSAKDSLSDAGAEQAIAELQTKYEVQKKENTIIQQQLTISQKNNFLLLVFSAAALVIVVAFIVFRDYRKKQQLRTAKLIEHEKHLSAKAIADAEENERKRIAADLHDNLGAYAASIASNLDIIQTNGMNEENRSALAELNNNSQTMVAQLSDTIWALNKDTLTLTAISDRIKVFLHRIRKSHAGIEMEVTEHIEQDITLPPTQAFHLFQVIQEAITNAVKHSAASKINIVITGNTSWKIEVADNGRGLHGDNNHQGHPLVDLAVHTPGGGNGLRNMRARAAAAGGIIEWDTVSPSGTRVTIVPAANKN